MRQLLLTLTLLCLTPAALANDWAALEQPGAFAIMRHALAPGTGDPANLTLDDCSTQRNLDVRGRDQAQRIGQAFRDRGVTFDQVFTSQWCRTRETAELLALGPVTDAPSLNSFFRDRSTAAAQTRDTTSLIAGSTRPIMLVTHQVNISALTGQFTRSGEVLVVRLTETGADVLGAILIDP